MSGFAVRVATLAFRHTAVVIVSALLMTTSMVIAGATPQAFACSDPPASSHCYAIAQSGDTSANHGVYGEVDIHCLYQPANGNFVTNEIWDVDSSGNNWEEVGVQSGRDYNLDYLVRNWFWADSRPGGGLNVHTPSLSAANANTAYSAEATYVGGHTWNIYGGNSFTQIGTSVNQTALTVLDEGGTEYMGSSTSGIRDVGDVYNLQREGTNGNFTGFGSDASNFDLGPGNYINGTYNAGNSHESWKGPC